MNKITTLAAALAATLSAGTAFAQFVEYGTESGWNILVNEAMGGGCLIQRTDDEGDQVMIGYNPAGDKGYIAAYSPWGAQIAPDQTIELTFDLDGQMFTGEAKGQEKEGYYGGFAWFNNPAFLDDLANKYVLTVSADGFVPFEVSLDGSKRAIEAAKACQAAQGS